MASSHVGFGQHYIATPCASLVAPAISGADVLKFTVAEVHNYSFPEFPIFQKPAANDISFCDVNLALRHTGADDTVWVTVWLPLEDWNGRYEATGGGGLAAGMGTAMLAGPVARGYAASTTDGGLTLNNTVDPQSGVWALNEDGTPNEALQLNLAWRSIHDMAVTSKDLIKQFYGSDPRYSYWTGCSQGGRQGYAAAAKYPDDFHGILAIAPAIDLPEMVPSDFWGPVVMRNSELPPSCVFEEYQKAIIAQCDPLDGVADGLISSHKVLESCHFDTSSLIGKTFSCGEGCVVPDPFIMRKRVPCKSVRDLRITSNHAEIVRKIIDGPSTADGKQLWYGVATGAEFGVLANVVLTDNGTREVVPFEVAENWLKYMALQDPSFDMTKMTHEEYEHGFDLSLRNLGPLWGNQQLDLSDFSKSGGKLLTWFGMADEYINPRGMLQYREGLEKKFGGAQKVDEFQRLFLAPGVGHCFGGTGPTPLDAIGVLVSWVEEGKAPEVLPAAITSGEGVETTRNLCRYPKTLVYQGGDLNKASSFSCSLDSSPSPHVEL